MLYPWQGPEDIGRYPWHMPGIQQPQICADIPGICYGHLPDIYRYPVGGTQALTLTEKN